MEKEIKLPNRDGIGTKFVQIENNVYRLEQDMNLSWGITGTLDNIIAVDPSGGPYITVGYEWNDYVVTDIKNDNGIKFILAKNKEINYGN